VEDKAIRVTGKDAHDASYSVSSVMAEAESEGEPQHVKGEETYINDDQDRCVMVRGHVQRLKGRTRRESFLRCQQCGSGAYEHPMYSQP
jgi:hypothetical protein